MDNNGWTVVSSKKKDKEEKKKHTKPVPQVTQSSAIPKPAQYSHQDWTPKVIRSSGYYKKEKVVEKRKEKSNAQTTAVNARKIEQNADDGNFELKKVTHDLKMQIQKARSQQNMTQEDLAKKCNLPVKVIKDYESGKGTPNSDYLSVIGKGLNTVLKK